MKYIYPMFKHSERCYVCGKFLKPNYFFNVCWILPYRDHHGSPRGSFCSKECCQKFLNSFQIVTCHEAHNEKELEEMKALRHVERSEST